MAFNKTYLNRIELCASKILLFFEKPTGFYKDGMILATEDGFVFGITVRHGSSSGPELTFTRDVLQFLANKNINVVYVNEQTRNDIQYKKFARLNRQNTTGWEQKTTLLTAVSDEGVDPETAREAFHCWKTTEQLKTN